MECLTTTSTLYAPRILDSGRKTSRTCPKTACFYPVFHGAVPWNVCHIRFEGIGGRAKRFCSQVLAQSLGLPLTPVEGADDATILFEKFADESKRNDMCVCVPTRPRSGRDSMPACVLPNRVCAPRVCV